MCFDTWDQPRERKLPFIGKLHLTCLKILTQMEFPFLTMHYLVNVGLQLLTFTAKSLIMTFLVLLLSSSLLPLQILFLYNSEPSVPVAYRLEQLQTDQKWKNKFTEEDNAAKTGRGGTWTGASIITLRLPLLWTGIVWGCFCTHRIHRNVGF